MLNNLVHCKLWYRLQTGIKLTEACKMDLDLGNEESELVTLPFVSRL